MKLEALSLNTTVRMGILGPATLAWYREPNDPIGLSNPSNTHTHTHLLIDQVELLLHSYSIENH